MVNVTVLCLEGLRLMCRADTLYMLGQKATGPKQHRRKKLMSGFFFFSCPTLKYEFYSLLGGNLFFFSFFFFFSFLPKYLKLEELTSRFLACLEKSLRQWANDILQNGWVRGFLEKGVMATNCWYAFFPGGYWGRLNTLSSLWGGSDQQALSSSPERIPRVAQGLLVLIIILWNPSHLSF